MASTIAARRELRDIHKLIREARAHLRAASAKSRQGLGREKKRLEKHQRVLAARIKKIADEYRTGRKRLRELRPAWDEITALIHKHEQELAQLRLREQRAIEEIARNKSEKRTSAARIAGKALQEKRGEWFHAYLGGLEKGYGSMKDNVISNAFAIATATRLRWPLRITPHEAVEKLAHIFHEQDQEYWAFENRRQKQLEKQWQREQWAQAAGEVPF